MMILGILSDDKVYKSKSPVMHTTVLRRQGLAGVYLPFKVEPDRVGEAVMGLRALNITGANVTVPYKEKVGPYLDMLSEEAAAIGAVNTIVLDHSTLEGHNTDAAGFRDALTESGLNPAGRTVLVFGAGGAARAVVYSLRRMRAAQIIVAGRRRPDPERAFMSEDEFQPLDALPGRAQEAYLVINATSVSAPSESPELASLAAGLVLPECRFVFDLNYGRTDNFWKTLARHIGAGFQDGLPMLAHQARHSFKLWTGMDVESRKFMQALEEGHD